MLLKFNLRLFGMNPETSVRCFLAALLLYWKICGRFDPCGSICYNFWLIVTFKFIEKTRNQNKAFGGKIFKFSINVVCTHVTFLKVVAFTKYLRFFLLHLSLPYFFLSFSFFCLFFDSNKKKRKKTLKCLSFQIHEHRKKE